MSLPKTAYTDPDAPLSITHCIACGAPLPLTKAKQPEGRRRTCGRACLLRSIGLPSTWDAGAVADKDDVQWSIWAAVVQARAFGDAFQPPASRTQRLAIRTAFAPPPERARVVPRREETRCRKGHLLSAVTLYLDPEGHQRCRTCRREAQRRARQRKGAR